MHNMINILKYTMMSLLKIEPIGRYVEQLAVFAKESKECCSLRIPELLWKHYYDLIFIYLYSKIQIDVCQVSPVQQHHALHISCLQTCFQVLSRLIFSIFGYSHCRIFLHFTLRHMFEITFTMITNTWIVVAALLSSVVLGEHGMVPGYGKTCLWLETICSGACFSFWYNFAILRVFHYCDYNSWQTESWCAWILLNFTGGSGTIKLEPGSPWQYLDDVISSDPPSSPPNGTVFAGIFTNYTVLQRGSATSAAIYGAGVCCVCVWMVAFVTFRRLLYFALVCWCNTSGQIVLFNDFACKVRLRAYHDNYIVT